MPTWTLDTNTAGLRTFTPPVATPAIDDVKPAGPVYDKHAGNDLGTRLHAAARPKPAASEDKGIRVGVTGEATLVKARQLIGEQKYMEALRLLSPLIRETPPEIASEVNLLRVTIRESMEDEVLDFVGNRNDEGDYAAALQHLDELLRLDANAGIYHCARVQTLTLQGRLEDAHSAVSAATAYCQGANKELLDRLADDLTSKRLRFALEPARQHYRDGNYRKARKALEPTQGQWASEPLWQTFHTYLEDLGGNLFWRGRKPAAVPPTGSFEDVDWLHFFLVREELSEGKELLGDDDAAAEVVFERGLGLAPHFPYLNYLLASAIFRISSDESSTDDDRSFDLKKNAERLARARRHAEIGVTDSEIEGAQGLLESIRSFEESIAKEIERIAKQNREMDQFFKPLADQFNKVMRDADGGITSPSQFRDLQGRLKPLRQGVPAAKRKVESQLVLLLMDALAKAVEGMWEQFQEIEPDVRAVEQLLAFRERLDAAFETFKKSDDAGAFGRLEKTFTTIRTDAQHFAKKDGIPDFAKEGAAELLKDMTELKKQLDVAKEQILDREKINPLISRLNSIGALSGNRYALRSELSAIREEGKRIRPLLRTQEGRNEIDKVVAVIAGIQRQMGG